MKNIKIKTKEYVITVGELTVKELTELISSLGDEKKVKDNLRSRFRKDLSGELKFIGKEKSPTGETRDIVETAYKGRRQTKTSAPATKSKKSEPKVTTVSSGYKPPYPHKNIVSPKEYMRRGLGGPRKNVQWTPEETKKMLILIGKGKSKKEIAKKLGRTEGMIKGHIQALKRKGWEI